MPDSPTSPASGSVSTTSGRVPTEVPANGGKPARGGTNGDAVNDAAAAQTGAGSGGALPPDDGNGGAGAAGSGGGGGGGGGGGREHRRSQPGA